MDDGDKQIIKEVVMVLFFVFLAANLAGLNLLFWRWLLS